MDCIFCKIVDGSIPSNKVYEDDSVLAFTDLSPQAPVHVLIIPKQHITSANDITSENSAVIAHIFEVAAVLARQLGIDRDGYRIVNNCGDKAGQSVKHMHFHMLGGRDFTWPPG
ncbi:MAG: histidine triad nucleotide-binding protein [Clostridia bacterium]|nr:histidine triad nucleotide-binding protein [Clostridia bacterium]